MSCLLLGRGPRGCIQAFSGSLLSGLPEKGEFRWSTVARGGQERGAEGGCRGCRSWTPLQVRAGAGGCDLPVSGIGYRFGMVRMGEGSMVRRFFLVVGGLVLVFGGGAVASAETVSVGPASASSVGAWVKPTGCSQFPVDYAGLPEGAYARIYVLDAVTRSDVGSDLLLESEPRSGRVNIQVCRHQVESTSSVLISLDVRGLGVADSAAFAWAARPGTVRCVNKKSLAIQDFAGKKCPVGWVKR